MKNKLKFSLLLMILMLIPTCVFAASIDIGTAKTEDGKTSWSVIYKGDNLVTGDVFDFNAKEGGNGMVTCSTVYTSPVAPNTGAVANDTEVPSSGLTIGTLTCQTTSTENQKGTVLIKGVLKTKNGNIDLVMSPKSYTVNAIRKKSSDSKLKSITVSQGTMSPEFKSDTFEYTVYNVKDTIASVKISWTCDYCTVTSSNAKATKAGSTSISYGIEKGNNDIEIEVQSEDGTNKDTYKITVIRGETEYNSAKISNLTFGDNKITPEFKEDTYEGYTVSVPYEVKDISKIATIVLKDPEATYEFKNGDNLTVGTNEVELVVTSTLKDNVVTYKLTVTRLNSDNITLISNKDNQITFVDADKAEQTLSIEEFKEKYPTVWKEIQEGKYKFDENGNLIENKNDKKSNNKTLIVIIVLIVAVIIIGLSGFFIFRKKDPEKEKEKIKKKAMKKARKDELKKLEEEYYKEYYNEDYEDDEEYEEEETEEVENETEEEEAEEIPSRSKKTKDKSLVEDDYIFEQSLVEEENEEEQPKSKKKDDVVDVDTALEDLMNTKTYDFSDEFEDLDK